MVKDAQSDDDELDLDPREESILRSVIREHIVSGEPIGSRTLSKGSRLDLSPATIRSVMAELEDRGLLTQPHVSAGRLPTDKAWRLYVDRWVGRTKMAPEHTRAIDAALGSHQGEIADLLETASRQLSKFSRQVGVVLRPEVRRLVVEHVEFVRLDMRRVVAILVGRPGVVHNRILELEEPIEQLELDRIGRYLSGEFRGRSLAEIRAELERRLKDDHAAYDRLLARSLKLGSMAVEAESGPAELIVDGTANLLDQREFSSDPVKMRQLMQALDRKKTLVRLLGRVLEDDGVQVVIGEEGQTEAFGACSVVASSYGTDDQVMGTLGIVGPTRMEYAQAIALVEYLAQVLNRYFSGGDN